MRPRPVAVAVTIALLCTLVASADPPRPPELPRVLLQTGLELTPVTGKTIHVAAGNDLQAALDAAAPGDEVVLAAGATFIGNFVLPAKGGADPTVQDLVPSEIEFRYNIMGFGLYGQVIDGGQNTFAEAFPELTWEKNLFVGYGEGRAQWAANSDKLPRGSFFEGKRTGDGKAGDADWPAVGFTDYAQGDYRLATPSKYRALGTDGKDLGVDLDALNAALRLARTH